LPSKKPDDTGAPGPGPAGARKLKVTLTRSQIGLKPNHVRTLRALGLRRIRATVWHADTPAVRGMLARVPYAIRVEEERTE
jgi:large subunit ribosomal protein L30